MTIDITLLKQLKAELDTLIAHMESGNPTACANGLILSSNWPASVLHGNLLKANKSIRNQEKEMVRGSCAVEPKAPMIIAFDKKIANGINAAMYEDRKYKVVLVSNFDDLTISEELLSTQLFNSKEEAQKPANEYNDIPIDNWPLVARVKPEDYVLYEIQP